MFLLGNVWLVLLKTGFMFLRTKKMNQTCSCSPMFLFFQNKNQFLNRFHVFVRECLVSVIENRFHVFKNKKKGTKLVLEILFSLVLFFFFKIKTSF